MASWYCGSVQYTAITQFAISTAYSVGNIVRQLATPAVNSERAFRCTTAGTSGGSEPSWTLTKGATTNSGTAVFTEVTGNSTYGWSAAGARLALFSNQSWAAAGDTIYVSEDHAESNASGGINAVFTGTAASPNLVLCVNHAGSVPPVSADLATTATVTSSAGAVVIEGSAYVYGITFTTSAASDFFINDTADDNLTLKNCKLRSTNNSTRLMQVGRSSTNGFSGAVWDNTTVEFGNAASGIRMVGGPLLWKNTPSAIVSGTLPTVLFVGSTSNGVSNVVLDGVDLSALGSGKTIVGANGGINQTSLRNCKLGSSVTVAATPTAVGNTVTVEISDSSGTGYRQEIYGYAGTLTPETTIVETGGASDGVQALSWKVVSTANAKQIQPFATFQIAQWNTSTGSAKTATIEIVNDGTTLKNNEVWVEVEYLGSSGSPIGSFVSSGTDVLSAGTNIPSSGASWGGSLSSPVPQYLRVSFTPQMVGYVRATVYVGKASQTLYIDPKMTIA